MTSKIPGFLGVGRFSATRGFPSGVLGTLGAGVLHESCRIVPLPELVPVPERLVDDELAVVAEADLHPLERAGRRPFEVDAILRVSRPVARALELALRSEPARGAAEVGADPEQRVEAAVGAHDPDALTLHPLLAHFADGVLGGVAGLEGGGRLEEDAREEHAQDGEARGAEAGEDRAPGGEREEVAAGPDAVPALRLRNAGISAGHRSPFLLERARVL